VNNTAATTFSGVMSGAGGLTKAGTANLHHERREHLHWRDDDQHGSHQHRCRHRIGQMRQLCSHSNGGTLTTSVNVDFRATDYPAGTNGASSARAARRLRFQDHQRAGHIDQNRHEDLAFDRDQYLSGGTKMALEPSPYNSDAALGDPAVPLFFQTAPR